MIPTKSRRLKASFRLPKNLERQYKQAKCQDCTVVVTRMNFAKILGKFTKVKIQFESNSSKSKRNESSPNTRLKNNENGMVLVHRSTYNPHPAKKLLGVPARKTKNNETSSPRQATSSPRQTPKSNDTLLQRQTKRNDTLSKQQNTKRNETLSPALTKSNILRENNRIKKPIKKDLENDKKSDNTNVKHYRIVFVNPCSTKSEVKSEINLDVLLPNIDRNMLPSEGWNIDYFPKRGEPKDDKIYDRIAAELEDLMYNEKTKNISDNQDGKNEEFPSILDILNDNPKGVTEKQNDHCSPVHLESSDVEAMLLGKSKSSEALPTDKVNPNTNSQDIEKMQVDSVIEDNPESPSILDEPEPKEIPVLSVAEKPLNHTSKNDFLPTTSKSNQIDENDNTSTKNKNNTKSGVTQVIFKKSLAGSSTKTVICPKNLKYNILIEGKSVELLGAPKAISSLEDLQVLLQIVDESELTSLYVLQ